MTVEPALPPQRIAEITLDRHTVVRASPEIEHERAIAITDLLKENRFTPASGLTGPFHVHLAVAEKVARSDNDELMHKIAALLDEVTQKIERS